MHAPNSGSRVPVDTAPGPVPVYRAPKSLPHIQPAQELHLRRLLLHTNGHVNDQVQETG